MFGIYDIADAIKLIGTIAFSVMFYVLVLRPMRLFANFSPLIIGINPKIKF